MKIKPDIILMYIFELQNIHSIMWHALRKNGVPKDTIIDPINTEITNKLNYYITQYYMNEIFTYYFLLLL